MFTSLNNKEICIVRFEVRYNFRYDWYIRLVLTFLLAISISLDCIESSANPSWQIFIVNAFGGWSDFSKSWSKKNYKEVKYQPIRKGMKTTITAIFTFLILTLVSCVTANINQPPYIVEGSTPGFRKDRSTTAEEDAYFNEASKRDAGVVASDVRPANAAPGYEDRRTTVIEKEPVQEQKQNDLVVIDSAPSATADFSDFTEEGIASWYGRDFDGRPTASGETFDSRRLTAAHKTIPLGTVVLVRNLENNKEVILKINDRGPFVKGRSIDVSEYASEVLGFKEKGLTRVGLKVIKQGDAAEKGDGATAMFFKRPENEATGGPESDASDNDNKDRLDQAKKELLTERDFSKYSVQIGLFGDLENAMRLKTYLGDRYGQPINIFRRGDEYLVKVGSFSDRYSADQLKTKLLADGYNGFVSVPGGR